MEEEDALKQFCLAARNLRQIMNDDAFELNDFDRISLENYISLLQMTYIEWKRRKIRQSDTVTRQATSAATYARDH